MRKIRQKIGTPAAMLLTAVVVAACGTASAATFTSASSTSTGTSTTGTGTGATTSIYGTPRPVAAFLACMHAHGVHGFGRGIAVHGGVASGQTTTSAATSTSNTSTSITQTATTASTVTGSTTSTSTSTGPQVATVTASATGPGRQVTVVPGTIEFSAGSATSGGIAVSVQGRFRSSKLDPKQLRNAIRACAKLLPKPQPLTAAQVKAAKAHVAAMVACLKKHGVGHVIGSGAYALHMPRINMRISSHGKQVLVRARIHPRRAVFSQRARHAMLAKLPARARKLMQAMRACGGLGGGLAGIGFNAVGVGGPNWIQAVPSQGAQTTTTATGTATTATTTSGK